MKKLLLIALLAIFSFSAGFAQAPWRAVTPEKARTAGESKPLYDRLPGKYFVLDAQQIRQTLAAATPTNAVTVMIPTSEGKMEQFNVSEYSNFDAELQAQFPEIRAYAGNSVDNPSNSIHFSMSPKGIRTMMLRADRSTEFIETYNTAGTVYILFTSADKRKLGKLPFTCTTIEDHALEANTSGMTRRDMMSNAGQLKKFRLALSCTGEYAAYHGGTQALALAAMNETMTRVNGVYAKDLAVKLEIIANNTAVIYTNANTDPYSPAAQMDNWNAQLQSTLTSTIGNANYDIGHLFGATGGGGDAGCIGCVCVNGQKGSGITSPSNGQPEGDTFDIDYVAHEMGHQLGGTHTFTVDFEGAGTNVEPGSGSTIMGYAGITGTATDVQSNSDDYFTYVSIQQIQNNLAGKACAVNTPINNPAMVIDAGPNYTIPKGTAFILKAANTANNNASVTYCWEQNDNPTSAAAIGNNSIVYATKPNGPNWRSYDPTTSPDRYMPKLEKVLANTLTADWESVSTVGRTLNFTLTGRDNVATGGQTQTDAMVVTVSSVAGPFAVTSQNTANLAYPTGSTQTVTWNVASTTSAGIGTSQVNIKLSVDNGQTFAYTLAANTPNDGTQSVTFPAGVSGAFCRIMVEAVGNIYYAVNPNTFAVGYTVTNSCDTYSNNSPLVIPDGQGTNSVSFGPAVANTVTVPGTKLITSVTATVSVSHTYVSDLAVILQHPDNTQAYLWAGNCGSMDGFNITFQTGATAIPNNCGTSGVFTGTYAPAEPLSVFDNKQAAGNWALIAADAFAQDTGQINSWSINVCGLVATAGVNEFGLADFRLYPNPNTGSFTVEFTSDSANDVEVIVHDMRGRQIMSKSYENSGMFSGNINLGNIETGVYMVTVQDGSRKEVKRIVVQ